MPFAGFSVHVVERIKLRECFRIAFTGLHQSLIIVWHAMILFCRIGNNVGPCDPFRLQLSPFFLAALVVQFCQRLIREDTNPVTRDTAADSRLEIHFPVLFAAREFTCDESFTWLYGRSCFTAALGAARQLVFILTIDRSHGCFLVAPIHLLRPRRRRIHKHQAREGVIQFSIHRSGRRRWTLSQLLD